MQTEEYLNELLGPYMLGVLISLCIGLILGLEREYDKRKDEGGSAGIRTFPIVTLLGYVMGHLSATFSSWFLIVGMGSLILFLGIGQVLKTRAEISWGITTNLALIATFLLGLMVSQELYRDSVATAVIVVTLLSLKTTFRSIIQNITHQELFAFIKFVIIALLILPFLPNVDYGPNGLLNPFEIGSIVVIVSFLNFIGYFLVKFVGSRKGILLTAILGGLISSTAVAWNYAARSKENPELSREYSAGIVVASAIMFPRLLLIAAIFNTAIVIKLAIPMLLLTLICLIPGILFIRKNSANADTQIDLGNPLNMLNALTFTAVFIGILYAVHYGNAYFGESGLYYSSLIAGLADTTAITISMAKFAAIGENLNLSASVIVAATLSNTVVKMGIAIFRGTKTTARLVGYVFGSLIIVGTIYILIVS
ncbi:MgtC/SapB family protein [Aequorivita sp. H23M31]|uniref:MgtC/SapB family protein n=1 Tax=Aequorivita ciconiae TaxID=2494375 RepID=A0A410G3Z8_9FLAO|nr:MgtC/SapB family protein [Aequorivita sp. H23M31]QAA82002.1 MgtC/SapB family protein [Aequorivita sp. H23M31]